MTQKTRYQLWAWGLLIPLLLLLALICFAFKTMINMPNDPVTLSGFGGLIVATLGLMAWITYLYQQLVLQLAQLVHQDNQHEHVEHRLLVQSLEKASSELRKSNEAIDRNAKTIEKMETALKKAQQHFNLQTLQQLVETIQDELKKQQL